MGFAAGGVDAAVAGDGAARVRLPLQDCPPRHSRHPRHLQQQRKRRLLLRRIAQLSVRRRERMSELKVARLKFERKFPLQRNEPRSKRPPPVWTGCRTRGLASRL